MRTCSARNRVTEASNETCSAAPMDTSCSRKTWCSLNMESQLNPLSDWFSMKGTFGTSQKTRPTRTVPHELMLHSRLEVPNMFQSLGDLRVPFMLHGYQYKAPTICHLHIYYIQRYARISIKYTENCQTWVSHSMELLAPALG